jgi:hypothetical protein
MQTWHVHSIGHMLSFKDIVHVLFTARSCHGMQWDTAYRAAIAALISGYRSGHLRPTGARPAGIGQARRSGQGSWADQGGGVGGIDPGGGGVSMYIGPPHI